MFKLEKIIEYGFYSLVFLLPLQTRWIWRDGEINGGPWEYGRFSLYVTDILLMMIIILGFVYWFRNRGSKISNLQFPISKIWWVIAFLELWIFLSIFWAENFGLALYGWARVLLGIGLFWLVSAVVKFDLKKFSAAFVASGVLQSLLAIWQFLTQKTFASKWLGLALHEAGELGQFVIETDTERFLRAYGTLPHPNMLAGFLVICLWANLSLFLITKQKNERILLFIAQLFIVTGLFFTFSRSGWLAFIMGLIIINLVRVFSVWRISSTLFREPQKNSVESEVQGAHIKLYTIIILVLITILTIIFWSPVQARFLGRERLEIQSNTERIVQYGEAWSLIKDQPFTGIAINNYTFAVKEKISSARHFYEYQPVHNVYLLILAELGLVGLILFFIFFIQGIFYSSLSIYHFKDNLPNSLLVNHYLLVPAFLSLITFFVIAFLDHYFWSLEFGQMLFWLILGVGFKSKLSPST